MINVNNKSTMLYSDLQIGDLLILQNTGFVVEAIELPHVTIKALKDAYKLLIPEHFISLCLINGMEVWRELATSLTFPLKQGYSDIYNAFTAEQLKRFQTLYNAKAECIVTVSINIEEVK